MLLAQEYVVLRDRTFIEMDIMSLVGEKNWNLFVNVACSWHSGPYITWWLSFAEELLISIRTEGDKTVEKRNFQQENFSDIFDKMY